MVPVGVLISRRASGPSARGSAARTGRTVSGRSAEDSGGKPVESLFFENHRPAGATKTNNNNRDTTQLNHLVTGNGPRYRRTTVLQHATTAAQVADDDHGT